MNNLKQLRENLKLSQKEIADKINITQQAYSLIESQKILPSLVVAEKISNLFEKSINEIFFAKQNN